MIKSRVLVIGNKGERSGGGLCESIGIGDVREREADMGAKHGITHRKNFLQRQERRGRDLG